MEDNMPQFRCLPVTKPNATTPQFHCVPVTKPNATTASPAVDPPSPDRYTLAGANQVFRDHLTKMTYGFLQFLLAGSPHQPLHSELQCNAIDGIALLLLYLISSTLLSCCHTGGSVQCVHNRCILSPG